MICLHEEETKGMPFLPKYQPQPITCQSRYRGRNQDLVERSKKMENSASENRKVREVGKEASYKAAKLNEEQEETPRKQTNQEESKMTPKRAKHD